MVDSFTKVTLWYIFLFISDTHDLQEGYAKSCHPGVINITGVFAENSDAGGLFIIVLSDKSGTPEHFEAATRTSSEPELSTSVRNISRGTNSVIMFDIGADGLPDSRAAINLPVEVLHGSNGSQGKKLKACNVLVKTRSLKNAEVDCVAIYTSMTTQSAC